MRSNPGAASVALLVLTIFTFCLVWTFDSPPRRASIEHISVAANQTIGKRETPPLPDEVQITAQPPVLPTQISIDSNMPGTASMTVSVVVQIVKDLILGFSAIFAASMTYRGLSTWRRQLKGNAEYELARRFLLCLYKTRNAIGVVRNSYMSSGEIQTAMVEAGHPADHVTQLVSQGKGNEEVYNRRWNALADSMTALHVEVTEMEVLHGKEIHEPFRELNRVVLELRHALNKYLRHQRERQRPLPDHRANSIEEQEQLERIIWGDYEETLTNEPTAVPTFSARVQTAISRLEAFAIPILKG